MGFIAQTFIFDDIPSEMYNLYFGEIGGNGESTIAGSNDVALLTKKIYRRPLPLFYGAEQTPVLEFPISVYCPAELTAPDYSDVAAWLWGQQQYKKLRICQNDMTEIYYNCFLTSPQVIRMGNVIQAFTTTVICDSPWAWKEPKNYTYNFGGGYSITSSIDFLNESANSFYTFPTTLTIVGNVFGGYVSIINTTDADRLFHLHLSPSETVTMNCDLQLISSDLVTHPLSNFNLNWLRFLRGINRLTVTGNVSSISVTSPVAVKMG